MSTAGDQANFPTMIIPRGTEIRVNAHGQLSIKTPGNLVIQNSGVYSEIESTNGSIRIEENITVEAVSIRAGQACFIQGTLTAWRVHAKRITLEDRARAFIMLQESEQLELSKSARLVGNFANEKELFFMMGKFGGQLKELPGAVDMTPPRELHDARPITARIPAMSTAPPPPPAPAPAPAPPPASDDENLRAAQALLEREMGRPDLTTAEVESLREVLFALRERDLQRIAVVWRDALARMRTRSDNIVLAADHLENALRASS
jgi:hypothetical protein